MVNLKYLLNTNSNKLLKIKDNIKRYHPLRDDICNGITKIERTSELCLVYIVRNSDEYMSGHRSAVRLVWVTLARIMCGINCVRFGLSAFINKVSI